MFDFNPKLSRSVFGAKVGSLMYLSKKIANRVLIGPSSKLPKDNSNPG